ncbi:hypothetical protein ARALYDRAFT_896030 [Arabidopsis lyrata subsp. lyrata]|uniref:Uncharacterized protein n=1 Tax=Arabidopsis lyrata subsp. lyrata TaxID=81972 RepID=D7KXQ4_ARALL|nr:hypothetical protein ARALYDRAFT_896030 [Arabidopsis lyrata subsp. lyrata]
MGFFSVKCLLCPHAQTEIRTPPLLAVAHIGIFHWHNRNIPLTSSSGSLNAEILWDLSEAEYENNGPEPIRRFFVVVVVNSEITLRIGDVDRKRDTSSSSWRVSKTERFSGTCWLTTKAQFSNLAIV